MTDVAIMHDYLTQKGGAERVVLALAEAFPGATIHTTVWDPAGCYPEFENLTVAPGILDRVPGFRRDPRLAFPVLAPVTAARRIDARVVIASSSGWAHGVRTDGRMLVYAHTPARWLHRRALYEAETGRTGRLALRLLGPSLTRWDRRAAARADRYIANSSATAQLIREVYDREAVVLHPPTTLDPSGPEVAIAGLDDGFALCIARPRGYKNVSAVVDAATRFGFGGRQLAVVGLDVETDVAGVRALGRVSDDEMRWLYAHAGLLVAAAHEDFGLTPVEAACAGTPTVALRAGGYLDSVEEGVTGLFFDRADPSLIADAVRTAGDRHWDADAIRSHADRFSKERFTTEIRRHVEELTSGG